MYSLTHSPEDCDLAGGVHGVDGAVRKGDDVECAEIPRQAPDQARAEEDVKVEPTL